MGRQRQGLHPVQGGAGVLLIFICRSARTHKNHRALSAMQKELPDVEKGAPQVSLTLCPWTPGMCTHLELISKTWRQNPQIR